MAVSFDAAGSRLFKGAGGHREMASCRVRLPSLPASSASVRRNVVNRP